MSMKMKNMGWCNNRLNGNGDVSIWEFMFMISYISRYKHFFEFNVIDLVSFLAIWITKKYATSGTSIKFGRSVCVCGGKTQTSKNPKLLELRWNTKQEFIWSFTVKNRCGCAINEVGGG